MYAFVIDNTTSKCFLQLTISGIIDLCPIVFAAANDVFGYFSLTLVGRVMSSLAAPQDN